jgi:sulfatase modifying factor 1
MSKNASIVIMRKNTTHTLAYATRFLYVRFACLLFAQLIGVFVCVFSVEAAPDSSGDSVIKPEMIKVVGGILSSESDLEGQKVKTFEIAKYEVTWREWQQVREWAANHGYDLQDVGQGSGDNYPVTNVSWYDAVKWCNAKSEMEQLSPVYEVNGEVYKNGDFGERGSPVVKQKTKSKGYRLPFDAEWEWAARGGKKSKGYTYSGSNDLNAVGWFKGNSDGREQAVGLKKSNELGLHDMNGNVWKWCWDSLKSGRRIRGGGWYNYAAYCTVGMRDYNYYPDHRACDVGFRIARSSTN